MTRLIAVFALVACSAAFAAELPTYTYNNPSTQPAAATQRAANSNPATQPAAAPAAADPTPRVLLLRFDLLGKDEGNEWIGRALQQNLLSELSRVKAVRPALYGEQPNEPIVPESALKMGNREHARYIVFGSYQVMEPELRITAQVLDTDTGKFIGAIKSTGAIRSLFEMEDDLSAQLKKLLPKDVVAAKPTDNDAAQPAVKPGAPVQQRQPTRYDGSDLQRAVRSNRLYEVPAYAYDRYYYDNNLYTPYYGGYGPCYGYSPFYSGIGFYYYTPTLSVTIGQQPPPLLPNYQPNSNVAGYMQMTTSSFSTRSAHR
ncbi:MAG TPA: hypothetical protein VIL86_03090 [Tepidisphaeraceae bacterium]|jgi:TolB-like protein